MNLCNLSIIIFYCYNDYNKKRRILLHNSSLHYGDSSFFAMVYVRGDAVDGASRAYAEYAKSSIEWDDALTVSLAMQILRRLQAFDSLVGCSQTAWLKRIESLATIAVWTTTTLYTRE